MMKWISSPLRPFHDAFIGTPRYDPLFPVILSKEEIEKQSDTGC